MLKRGTAGNTKKTGTSGKERNYTPFEEAGDASPHEDVSTEQLDNIISLFGDGEMDLDVGDSQNDGKTRRAAEEGDDGVESDDASLEDTVEEEAEEEEGEVGVGKTDDPVRLYLKEMGTVPLLSKERKATASVNVYLPRFRSLSASRNITIGQLTIPPIA